MRRFQISVLLLGTLALLTSCSRNPMSPDPSGGVPGGAQMAGIQVDDTPSGVDGGSTNVAQVSLQINKEGRLTVGRWTLDVHKNSLKMPATITMRVASDDATEVEFDVVPAEANDFKVAPKLYASLSDRPQTNWATVGMWSWVGGAWQPATGFSANETEKNVVAHLKRLVKTMVAEPEEGTTAASEGTMTR